MLYSDDAQKVFCIEVKPVFVFPSGGREVTVYFFISTRDEIITTRAIVRDIMTYHINLRFIHSFSLADTLMFVYFLSYNQEAGLLLCGTQLTPFSSNTVATTQIFSESY